MLIHLFTAFPCSSKPPTEKQGRQKKKKKIKQPLHHLIYHGFYEFICKNIQTEKKHS